MYAFHRTFTPLLVLSCLLGIGCHDTTVSAEPATEPPSRAAVTSLGRLEPGLGVIDVGALPGDRVRSLEVAEGDRVRAGELLAVLYSRDERQAQVAVQVAAELQAKRDLERARELMPTAIAASEAEVRRLEADLALARSDLNRSRALVAEDVRAPRDEEYQAAVEAQADAALDAASARLEQEKRRRKLDVAAAEAALQAAQAARMSAQAALEQSEIRALVDGEILDLFVLPGESTDRGAILRMGEIDRMYAVAEVYETDAHLLRAGQTALISSPALPEPLTGRVEQIASMIAKNDVLSIDPVAASDARVVEARILLDRNEAAARFIHLQVDVRIELGDQ